MGREGAHGQPQEMIVGRRERMERKPKKLELCL